ncbi:MAG: aminotransferase class I/II-fold pyridoxal phosphate-dependent enzyme [Lawsonibacter sp.]|nr:aminotransferase class I/II-fold pyridoxal phosphate-dependent enzyme [Lawsonibacter sp.]
MEDKTIPFSWKSITETMENSLLDFSVNINALGIPETVKQQLPNLSDIAGVYPDSGCKYLSSCLAKKYHIRTSRILCGNGADDLLYRLVFAAKPKHAVVCEPTFEEYSRALKLVGCEVHHYTGKADNNFSLDEGILPAIQTDCDMVFLCNPNNPTGQIVSPQLLHRIIECCQRNQVLLAVDECFIEFLPDWEKYTLKGLAAQSENLIVIDAFTKTYSMAGFRLGFCISGNADLLSDMRLCGQSFAVSTPAQLAGVCALMDRSYMEKTYQMLSPEREWLFSELQVFPLKVYPSKGNFFLIKTEKRNIGQILLENGVKVRDCSRFYGLDSDYCRIAILTHDKNMALVKVLKTIFI